jgi:hypothetical protein
MPTPTTPDFGYWHIAATDVRDGMSAVGERRHRIPGASVGQPIEPCLARREPLVPRLAPIINIGRLHFGAVGERIQEVKNLRVPVLRH